MRGLNLFAKVLGCFGFINVAKPSVGKIFTKFSTNQCFKNLSIYLDGMQSFHSFFVLLPNRFSIPWKTKKSYAPSFFYAPSVFSSFKSLIHQAQSQILSFF